MDHADRFADLGRHYDLVRRKSFERRADELDLVAGFLQVELETDASRGRVENLIQGRVFAARPWLVMRDHDHAVFVAPDVDFQEVGSGVEQARVALVRAY